MLLKLVILVLSSLTACITAEQAALQLPRPQELSSESSIIPAETSKELLSLHRKLVEIESISGNEDEVGHWLASYLESKNFTVELQEVRAKRFNVFAYKGKNRKTPILVSTHIDTVPPYWPYVYNKTSNIISGRGSVDAKASVAAQITAVLSLEDAVSDKVSLLFVVDEERYGLGMQHFSDHAPHAYDAVIFGEPTEAKLVCGHKGIISFEVNVEGKAAHSGYPWLGVSANDALIEALGKLIHLRENLPWSTKYGNTTMNIGRIEGGLAANVVAESAMAKIAVRIAAGTPKVIEGLVIGALKDVKAKVEDEGGALEINWIQEGYPPVDIDCDIKGFETMTVNYGTDVPNLKGDHKRYLYGPGSIFVAHSAHETLKVEDLEKAVKDFERLILATLK
ncbi:Zn-dependent exopeptidase [Mytilinidion resinicola]|uniref:Zn-dependent exopeptidase n=1 Tax=Mytilinidion resinicola TaxID=574789 RepID=A0A6A6YNC8_9PEZI|nr:Zn-dependent exopeptidase [Mytilinidion resinicola]KAF2810083.1 Zn-dependent exopeptidase [Mytilinidion resinicola]